MLVLGLIEMKVQYLPYGLAIDRLDLSLGFKIKLVYFCGLFDEQVLLKPHYLCIFETLMKNPICLTSIIFYIEKNMSA